MIYASLILDLSRAARLHPSIEEKCGKVSNKSLQRMSQSRSPLYHLLQVLQHRILPHPNPYLVRNGQRKRCALSALPWILASCQACRCREHSSRDTL